MLVFLCVDLQLIELLGDLFMIQKSVLWCSYSLYHLAVVLHTYLTSFSSMYSMLCQSLMGNLEISVFLIAAWRLLFTLVPVLPAECFFSPRLSRPEHRTFSRSTIWHLFTLELCIVFLKKLSMKLGTQHLFCLKYRFSPEC